MICNDKGSQTQSAATDGRLVLKNIVFAGMKITGSDKDASFKDSLSVNSSTFDKTAAESFSSSYFKQAGLTNLQFTTSAGLMLKQPVSLAAGANWGPSAGSPLTGKENLFTDNILASPFFDKVNFIGAFRSDAAADNWTLKWANFDPQNTAY
jgi:hypothetical protein